jgi:hypothetical protein
MKFLRLLKKGAAGIRGYILSLVYGTPGLSRLSLSADCACGIKKLSDCQLMQPAFVGGMTDDQFRGLSDIFGQESKCWALLAYHLTGSLA